MESNVPMPDVRAIVRELGGPAAVAGELGITSGAVSQWSAFPLEHIPKLVALGAGRYTARDLRPDYDWPAVCAR